MFDTLNELFMQPFTDFAFMRRALVAGWILALSGTPLGVFMMLRRMSLVGDALAHAILPGVAVSFLIAGLSVWAMTIGGVAAAVLVALLATALVRTTQLKEDAAFTLLYLLSLAAGVILVSLKGSSVNLLHVLFGNILAINAEALYLITSVSCFSMLVMAVLYRRFVIDGFDGDFLRVAGASRRWTGLTSSFFFILLMLNLVAAFQAMGTLMALGLILLPSIGARFWGVTLDKIMSVALLIAFFSVYAGLMLSYHYELPSGPSIVMISGGIAFVSSIVGRFGSLCHFGRC